MIRVRAPELEVDGEMHADAALVQAIRDKAVPDSRLKGSAQPADHANAGRGQHFLQCAESRR